VTIERLAFGLLAVLALLMGINVVGASERFGSATESFDGLTFELDHFEYTGPDQPVLFGVRVINPEPRDVEIIAFTFTMSANGHSVGGGESRPIEVVAGSSDAVFPQRGIVNDARYMERLDPSEPVDWLVFARVLVNVDDRLDPTWVNFSFRMVTE
jgi:hypothetical protein